MSPPRKPLIGRHSPALFDGLTPAQLEALKQIVLDWIGEGFTGRPYEDAYYDILEALGLAQERLGGFFDTRRPQR